MTPGRTIVMNQSGRVSAPSGNQKIVFLAQRSQTPSNPAAHSQQNQPSPNTVVKFVSNSTAPNTQKVVTAQQKLVVVCMSNSSTTTTPSQSNVTSLSQLGVTNQANQPSVSVVSKNFIQQQKLKEQIAPMVDDLSHLA